MIPQGLLQTLNAMGELFLSLAWPMFWQSSVTIGVVLLLTATACRRARPSLRYALWMVALVKLALPPSFALPTSPAWWLRSCIVPAHYAPVIMPAEDTTPRHASFSPRKLAVSLQETTPTNPPRPALTAKRAVSALDIPGLAFTIWAVGITALLLRTIADWRRASRLVRSASAASSGLTKILSHACGRAGGRRTATIRVTEETVAPGLYGILKPTVILPAVLCRDLPPAEMESVVLHELLHLRRADHLINLLQTGLQLLYWWHPVVWFANARIRRVREEAVDEEVLVALANERDVYASALLHAARVALTSAPARAGMLGIFESRSALRKRIERLIEFRAHPHRKSAAIGSMAALGVALMAVPLGRARVQDQGASTTSVRGTGATEISESLPVQPGAARLDRSALAALNAATSIPVNDPPRPEAGTADAPRITLRAQFLFLPEAGTDELGLDWLFGCSPTNNPPTRHEFQSELVPEVHGDRTNNIRLDWLSTRAEFAVLNPEQFQALERTLRAHKGSEFVFPDIIPVMTLSSGGTSELFGTDMKTLFTGAQGTGKGINYETDTIGFGPRLDLTATAVSGGWSLQMVARHRQFLGYADPGKSNPSAQEANGQTVPGTRPLPHIRVLESQATAVAHQHQTVVLRGPAFTEPETASSADPRSRRTAERKRLYVFISIVSAETSRYDLTNMEHMAADLRRDLEEQTALIEKLRQSGPDALAQAKVLLSDMDPPDSILSDTMKALGTAEGELLLPRAAGPVAPGELARASENMKTLTERVTIRVQGVLMGLKVRRDSTERTLEALKAEIQTIAGRL